eukprot:TRINITY_DN109269_c0_g1_i1.p1 TRINITY_DN109269_c0_g1~~TRINITY_DN109269_c0_g1_i1.p1  ORF type:complete len:127 (-),score=4.89 TRINITY_DN109269_c0_g1_i1:126-506(-)
MILQLNICRAYGTRKLQIWPAFGIILLFFSFSGGPRQELVIPEQFCVSPSLWYTILDYSWLSVVGFNVSFLAKIEQIKLVVNKLMLLPFESPAIFWIAISMLHHPFLIPGGLWLDSMLVFWPKLNR